MRNLAYRLWELKKILGHLIEKFNKGNFRWEDER